jgi:hypothetical protein
MWNQVVNLKDEAWLTENVPTSDSRVGPRRRNTFFLYLITKNFSELWENVKLCGTDTY